MHHGAVKLQRRVWIKAETEKVLREVSGNGTEAFVLQNSFPSLRISLEQYWQPTTFQFALNYLTAAENAKLGCSEASW